MLRDRNDTFFYYFCISHSPEGRERDNYTAIHGLRIDIQANKKHCPLKSGFVSCLCIMVPSYLEYLISIYQYKEGSL